jgi:two-component sensor histidine kinase
MAANERPFSNVDGRALAQAIVDTVREPLVVLDGDLRVIAVSRSYYLTFGVNRQETQGRMLYELGDGQWNIPELRLLLSDIGPEHSTMEAFEVSRVFPGLGQRTMLLNARKVFYEGNNHTTMLLAIEDITERRAIEKEKDELLREKDLLLKEMQHRIYNSLQLIASILLLKARTVLSEETRQHLKDAHQRVLAVAAVQRQLEPSKLHDMIEVGPYLSRLCESLATSMIRDGRPLFVEVRAGAGAVTSSRAVSLGLITTELVLNALKHAFADRQSGSVIVEYDAVDQHWSLSVTDNGTGRSVGVDGLEHVGLGTGIIEVLARQLNGQVETVSSSSGTKVSITHAA